MKSKFSLKRIGAEVGRIARAFWRVLTNRFGLKLLSFILAIMLWNYVVSNNTALTRSKMLTGIQAFISGQSALSANGLALTESPTDSIGSFSVRIEVAQSDYSRATDKNVQVMLDLSNVRTAGTHEVPLKATSTYGRVEEIIPSSVRLEFEQLDSRSVPISVRLVNEAEDMWYNVTRTNPVSLTISGASSVVRRVSQARIESDVAGETGSFIRAESYVLLDSEGNEIDQSMLSRTASSVTVIADVYPKRDIPISTDSAKVAMGRLPQGYAITGISVKPEKVTVAAEGDLLEDLSELLVEPVDVSGHAQSFSARAKLSKLADIKYLSNEEVYVTITIEEIAAMKENGRSQEVELK